MTPESRLISAFARKSTERFSRRVVRELQQIKDLLSGDDSGLENVWDEICVQIQGQESFFWSAYDETVRAVVVAMLDKVPITELQVVWFQTDAGEEWLEDSDRRNPETPWNRDDVVEYIVAAVYDLAANWSNRRIRAYLGED
jgi:hypothetical protein